MRTAVLFTLLTTVTMLTGVAQAETVDIQAEALNRKARDLSELLGKTVRVEAKFKECWGGKYVSLVAHSELKFYVAPSSKIAERVKRDLDSNGKPLVNETSNVEIVGSVVRNQGFPTSQKIVLRLDEIRRIADDVPRFEARLAATDRSAEKMHDVAAAARRWARIYKSQALQQWAIELDRKSLEKRAAALKPDDVEGWIKLADDTLRLLEDRPLAIRRLDTCFRALDSEDDKRRKAIARKLESLKAYFYEGQWIGYDEFKRREGFVERKQGGEMVWIRRERAEFEDLIAKDLERTVASLIKMDAYLKNQAEKGRIVLSMRPTHVTQIVLGDTPLGLPAEVDRVRRTADNKVERVYVQWIYPGNRRFYFVDGRLFAKRTPNDPWPDK